MATPCSLSNCDARLISVETTAQITDVMSTIHAMSTVFDHRRNDTAAFIPSTGNGLARRKHIVLAGAATVFISSASAAYWAGHLPAPSLILAAGTAYLACMSYLTIVGAGRFPPQVVDDWLGAGVNTVKPGSDDAAMHLELGTLSLTRMVRAAEEASPVRH